MDSPVQPRACWECDAALPTREEVARLEKLGATFDLGLLLLWSRGWCRPCKTKHEQDTSKALGLFENACRAEVA